MELEHHCPEGASDVVKLERAMHLVGRHLAAQGLSKGDRILEVGCGRGHLSVSLAMNGAGKVVGLEPELAGSVGGTVTAARALVQGLELEGKVEVRSDPLEAFLRSTDNPLFSHVVLNAVINHLDEEAVQSLHKTEASEAWTAYLKLAQRIGGIMHSGGTLAIADCGRLNFWNAVGLRSPFAPSIEWNKHQQPKVWAKLLNKAGFNVERIIWNVPFRLRALQFVFGKGVCCYFLSSQFTILARKR